ncbi:hypothetical protein DFH28DRAFT_850133, partial [Melampsora americana]
KVEVNFCNCQTGQVYLIQIGYPASCPIHPDTAFSVQLLCLDQPSWKHCSMSFLPFASVLDSFLDPHNPLVKAKAIPNQMWPNSPTMRILLRSTLMNAYQMMEELANASMVLTMLEQFGKVCPACLGPQLISEQDNEPDYVI